ncbi:unnamed protein product, partial [Agarophyton chilense]
MPRSPVKILTRKDTADADSKHLGVLRRPWIRIRNNRIPDRVLVMAKRNYKVYADLGLHTQFMVRHLTVLDTGAGPNFIVESLLPPPLRSIIRSETVPDVLDANNNPLKTAGVIDLVIRLGRMVVKLTFIVCRSLAAPVILGCHYCDRFFDAIRPRLKQVELEDGSTVPIVRQPLKRASRKHVPLSAAKEPTPTNRDSTKLRVASSVTIPPESQVMVSVNSRQHGLQVVQPLPSLYEKFQLTVANGIVQVTPNSPFRVLVANLGKAPQTLAKNQVIG